MRHTDDPKEYTIKARVNEDMYNYIKNQADKQGKKISEVIRQLIQKGISK